MTETKSRFKCVRVRGRRFQAYGIEKGGARLINLGTYDDEMEAAKIAAAWRVAHRGSNDASDLTLAEGVKPPPYDPRVGEARLVKLAEERARREHEEFMAKWDVPGSEYHGVYWIEFAKAFRISYRNKTLGYFKGEGEHDQKAKDEAARFLCAWRVAYQTGRIVTKQQAAMAEGHPRPPKDGKPASRRNPVQSAKKGVYYVTDKRGERYNRWRASYKKNGKNLSKECKTEEEAIEIRERWEREHG